MKFFGLLNGFRKLSIMATLVIVAIVFRVLDYINGAEFVDLLKGTAIAFFSMNGIEHLTKTVKEWVKNKITKE